jgi:signal transduction histidine kinase
MLALMRYSPDWATIPYHLLFLSIILVYGFRVWPLPAAVAVVVAVTLVTGTMMIVDARAGVIEGTELAEVPLMPMLLVAMVWHARRRAAAISALEEMAEVQQALLERERQFFRDTSHAIRTPVTIARGHLELAVDDSDLSSMREDLGVAVRQLDRMTVLSNRLLALAQLDSGAALPSRHLDAAAFLLEVGGNWTAVPGRRWVLDAPQDAVVAADPVWLALAVDAVVENAVHHTREGEQIEIRLEVSPNAATIVVTDEGPGVAPVDRERVFDRFWHRRPPNGPMGSGLGLAMTRATARAFGGDAVVAPASGHGARFEVWLPRVDTDDVPVGV